MSLYTYSKPQGKYSYHVHARLTKTRLSCHSPPATKHHVFYLKYEASTQPNTCVRMCHVDHGVLFVGAKEALTAADATHAQLRAADAARYAKELAAANKSHGERCAALTSDLDAANAANAAALKLNANLKSQLESTEKTRAADIRKAKDVAKKAQDVAKKAGPGSSLHSLLPAKPSYINSS